jgi:hypothetical protein
LFWWSEQFFDSHTQDYCLFGKIGGQFELIPSNSLWATLLDGSPAVSTVHIETDTRRAVRVLDDFLNNTSHARLSGGEGVSNYDCGHFVTLLPFSEPTFCLLRYL